MKPLLLILLSILLSPIATAQTQPSTPELAWVCAPPSCRVLEMSVSDVQTPAPAKPAKPKHAMLHILSVAASPATHPKRTLKQVFGSVLFAVETGVDGARIGLEGADKVFDVLSIQGKVPVLDQVYAVVSIGAKDAAKADLWLERQEQGLFGTHN